MGQRVGWPAWLVVAVVAVGLMLGACGGDDSPATVAPDGENGGAAAQTDEPQADETAADAGNADAADAQGAADEVGTGDEPADMPEAEAEPESFAIQLTLGTPLDLRPGPALDWGVSATLPQGTPAAIVARHADGGGWLLVRGEGAEGWARASSVAVVEEQVARLPGVEPSVVTATAREALDLLALDDRSVIGRVTAGESVEVAGRTPDGSMVVVVTGEGISGLVAPDGSLDFAAPLASIPGLITSGLWVIGEAGTPVTLLEPLELYGARWAGDPPWLFHRSWDRGEGGELSARIVRFDPSDGEEEVLTEENGTFLLQPGGTGLVFRAGATEDGRAQIWFTRPGATPFLLTSQAPYQGDGVGGYLETTARWSPDGQMLLLEDAFTRPDEGEPCCPIRVVGPALGQRVVAQGSNPRWSVNDWVLFLDAEGALSRVTINGGRRFLSVEASGVWFEQSADMTALVISRDGRNLNFVDLVEGRARSLRPADVETSLGGAFHQVGALWSPNSRFVAFNASGTELGVYDRESDTVTVIEAGALPTARRQVAWSPDGMRLAYVTEEGLSVWDGESGASSLLVAGVDGHEVDWSPDGTRLSVAFGLGTGPADGLSAQGRSTFGVYDAASGAAEWVVRKPPGPCFEVEWSRDGAWLSVGAAPACA